MENKYLDVNTKFNETTFDKQELFYAVEEILRSNKFPIEFQFVSKPFTHLDSLISNSTLCIAYYCPTYIPYQHNQFFHCLHCCCLLSVYTNYLCSLYFHSERIGHSDLQADVVPIAGYVIFQFCPQREVVGQFVFGTATQVESEVAL